MSLGTAQPHINGLSGLGGLGGLDGPSGPSGLDGLARFLHHTHAMLVSSRNLSALSALGFKKCFLKENEKKTLFFKKKHFF
jgi:hypothetical protein